MEYLRSLSRHLGTAFVDVAAASLLSLLPLLFARLEPFARAEEIREPFWSFLYNGQLAFYSLGSLAVLLMAVFRKKLPTNFGILVGLTSLCGLIFLTWLIGIDPSLTKAETTFVGIATFYIYVIVQTLRIIVDAAKQVDPGDALAAGDRFNRGIKAGLADKKGVSLDD